METRLKVSAIHKCFYEKQKHFLSGILSTAGDYFDRSSPNSEAWQASDLCGVVLREKCDSVCRTVHDFKPKKFDAEQCNVLCNFAEMTVREIQRITESSMQRSMSLNLENEQLLRSIDDCSDGVVLLDVRIPRWPVLFSNEGWSQLTGRIRTVLACVPPYHASIVVQRY